MRILFLIPPAKNKTPERIYGCSYQLYTEPELPVLYAASLLQKSNYQVDFRNFTLEDNSQKSFEQFLKNSFYQVYIFHSVLLSKEIDLESARKIRQFNKDAFIIFFGPEPTRIPREFLLDDKCVVARGEAEFIIKNLIDKIESNKNPALSGIRGISYLNRGEANDNPCFGIIENLDDLPFPARSLTQKYQNKYYNSKIPQKPYHVILTSRGCSFRCYYCVPNSVSWARELEWKKYNQGQKPPLKLRSAENIIEEFKELAKQGYKSIQVMDDMFLWGKERCLSILRGIKDLNIEIGVLSRADFIDEDIAKALKEANCKIVAIGAESFCQETLDYIKKDLKAESIFQAVRILKKYGIIPEINLMIGVCPLETKEKIKETIQKAIDLDVKYVLFSVATPFPGTELQKRAEQEGWLIKEKYDNIAENLDPSSKGMLCFPNLSNKELEKLLKYANLKFYFRPKYIWWRFKEMKSFSEIIMLVKTAFKIIRHLIK